MSGEIIDAVNDLDNVLYEISNESGAFANAWQYHMIKLIHVYEAGKPKQHPVGMTFQYPGGSNSELFNQSGGLDFSQQFRRISDRSTPG